jgi:hypothetical protein
MVVTWGYLERSHRLACAHCCDPEPGPPGEDAPPYEFEYNDQEGDVVISAGEHHQFVFVRYVSPRSAGPR